MKSFLLITLMVAVGLCSTGINEHHSHKGEHGINYFLGLSYLTAKKTNQSACWVCAALPKYVQGGLPMGAIPWRLEEVIGMIIWRDNIGDFNMTNYGGCHNTTLTCTTLQYLQERGLEPTSFTGSYAPKYNRSHTPPYLTLNKEHEGNICFQVTYGLHLVGWSHCNLTIAADISTSTFQIPGWDRHTPQFGISFLFSEAWGAPNGAYFICGKRAYPWLPAQWSGSCYLGYVVPHIHVQTHSPFGPNHRPQRKLADWEYYLGIIFPQAGMNFLSRELIQMASTLEELANSTLSSLKAVNDEMVALRTVAMQNRLALDYVLAAQGGTCAVIGTECCTYIPDNSEHISDLTQ
uniref:Uncharacterized protein n=1 Tax=Lepisosteus oculatus TaxID=7918 RepID=W5NLV1_LEPOC